MTIELGKVQKVFQEVHARVSEEAKKEEATHRMYRSTFGSDTDAALDKDLQSRLDIKAIVEELAEKLGIDLTPEVK